MSRHHDHRFYCTLRVGYYGSQYLNQRSLLQWLGGIGFIVMAVAILPTSLNVGGMRLFRTESSDWDDKAVPRTQSMAKYLFFIYILLTVCLLRCLSSGGNDLVSAINRMTTLSTRRLLNI